MVKNKASVEGSICEAYLVQETSHFCSYYFDPHMQKMRNKVSRNDDGGENEEVDQTSTIFNHPSRSSGTSSSRYLNHKELDVAHFHVILNCKVVQPFIK